MFVTTSGSHIEQHQKLRHLCNEVHVVTVCQSTNQKLVNAVLKRSIK